MLLLVVSCGAAADDATTEQKDVAAVTKFLTEKFSGMTWGRGPTRIQNDAITTAYGEVLP